jgi:hypothetical protein
VATLLLKSQLLAEILMELTEFSKLARTVPNRVVAGVGFPPVTLAENHGNHPTMAHAKLRIRPD